MYNKILSTKGNVLQVPCSVGHSKVVVCGLLPVVIISIKYLNPETLSLKIESDISLRSEDASRARLKQGRRVADVACA